MAWIASHQSLKEHPKTSDLAARMGWTRAETIGRLQMLWWWCLDYAINGDLSRFTAAQIAAAMEASDDGEKLVRALIDARWLDATPKLRIHDWWEHAGLYLKQRWRRTPERYQAVQDEYEPAAPYSSGVVQGNVPCTVPGTVLLTNQQTVPTEQTVPNPTNPPTAPVGGLVGFPASEAEAGMMGERMGISSAFAVEIWKKTRGRGVKHFAAYLKTAWQRHLDGAGTGPVEPAKPKTTVNARLL